MPITYRIDISRGLVLARVLGSINPEGAVAHLHALGEDPDFEPSFDLIFDLTESTGSRATPAQLRAVIEASPFGSGSRRAAVVSEDYAYGMARMYEVYVEDLGGEFQVFRSLEEARAWLGLSEDEE